MPNSNPILRCEGLTKLFDGVKALDGLSINFPPTGIIAIIGPNGAGKTTLLNVLTGFLHATSGRCFFGVRETSHLPPHKIARLGIARSFQDSRLITRVRALDNVMVARPHQRGEHFLPALLGLGVAREESANREEAMRLLRFVGLETKTVDLAGELSYGQQRLLTLACCLATGAPVLLLDEPVAGVAPQMVSHVLELLRQLGAQGKLVVFVEHDMEAVRQVADLVIVMDHGKLIAQGPAPEVLERPEIMEAYLG
jgi:ABC-type branched-subunit amino acid transport system ATPase component